ncbi:ATP-dependent RNA helicase [Salix suchowensis]|nr:ATP-dependent RNA helicase [Salix suchowensis]
MWVRATLAGGRHPYYRSGVGSIPVEAISPIGVSEERSRPVRGELNAVGWALTGLTLRTQAEPGTGWVSAPGVQREGDWSAKRKSRAADLRKRDAMAFVHIAPLANDATKRQRSRRPPRGNQNAAAAASSSGNSGGGIRNNQTNANANANTKPKRGEIPCRAWRAGSCAKGTKCWFGHDPEAQRHRNTLQAQVKQLEEQALERNRLKEYEDEEREIARVREEARVRVQREQRELARIAEEARIQEALRTRMAEIARKEVARTTQFFILGSLVTFGAGLDVRHLVTGFECCTVQIKNLPADAREAEIANIFLDQGIDAGRFQIQESRVTPEGGRTATIVTDAESGMAMAAGLEGVEFREEKLVFEVGSYNLPGGMGTSAVRDTDVLTISWRSPSVRFVAEFSDMEETRRHVQALNGKVLMGRRVKVTVNTPPPGRSVKGFNPNSIMINNLNPAVDEESIRQFTGTPSVRRMRQPVTQQRDQEVINVLRLRVADISDGLQSLDEVSSAQKTLDGITTVKARFESSDAAERVHHTLSDGTFARSMGIKESVFWVHLPVPMQYTITVPNAQYAAQKHQWDALVESIKDKSACNLVIHEQRNMDVVRMRLLGKVKEAVGALKVRVENLVAGEKIEGGTRLWVLEEPVRPHRRARYGRLPAG